MSVHDHGVGGIDRRKFVAGAAGTLASACLIGSFYGASAARVDGFGTADPVLRRRQPDPRGLGSLPACIHTFVPGDPCDHAAVHRAPLGGFDVEPGTITDFDGRARWRSTSARPRVATARHTTSRRTCVLSRASTSWTGSYTKVRSRSFELISSTPVRGRKSTTSTAASSRPGSSGRSTCAVAARLQDVGPPSRAAA